MIKIFSKIKFFLFFSIIAGLIASCGGLKNPLSPEQIDELNTSFSFEDQDPDANTVGGPVSLNIPSDILDVLQSTSGMDMLDVYLVDDAAASDFGYSESLVSTPVANLVSGVNELGWVTEGTFYQEGDLLLLTFADSQKEKKAKSNPINSGVFLYVYDYIALAPSDVEVQAATAPEAASESEAASEAASEAEVESIIYDDVPAELDIRLSNVKFDYDKSIVKPGYLNQLASELEEFQDDFSILKVYIAGHADERGTREYNIALGDRRANAVKRVLVSMGIRADNILTVSFGEERPLFTGSTEAAWGENRRAEIAAQVPNN